MCLGSRSHRLQAPKDSHRALSSEWHQSIILKTSRRANTVSKNTRFTVSICIPSRWTVHATKWMQPEIEIQSQSKSRSSRSLIMQALGNLCVFEKVQDGMRGTLHTISSHRSSVHLNNTGSSARPESMLGRYANAVSFDECHLLCWMRSIWPQWDPIRWMWPLCCDECQWAAWVTALNRRMGS